MERVDGVDRDEQRLLRVDYVSCVTSREGVQPAVILIRKQKSQI
jgi:hypothetical protein